MGGYLRPGPVTDETYEQATTRTFSGAVDGLMPSGERCAAMGWAALPDPWRPADGVVITIRTPGETKRTPVAIACPEQPRPDVAKAMDTRALRPTGWRAEFPAPAPGQELEAWAIDGRDGALYPLRLHYLTLAPASASVPAPATQP